MNKLILTTILLFNQLSFACDKPVSYLQKGQPTPCTGYLLSPEKEEQARTAILNYTKLEAVVTKQDELIQVLDKRAALNIELASNLRKELNNVESRNTLEKTIYFVIGIAVGVGFMKALNK